MDKNNCSSSVHAQMARKNFLCGYNCPQSVLLSYADFLEIKGLDVSTVLKMASPFGGGISRLREVCGAVSALCMLIGLTRGYDTPDDEMKTALYTKIQELAGQFGSMNGSIICRVLLGLDHHQDEPVPEKRTAQYYENRPCANLCAAAAALFEPYYEEEMALIKAEKD
ncbi:MAG: C_GCAxxG_C_C family protein [Succinivibrio sp.]|nr:C_GCAxxG_C_C family protein [Succinivibrio sp.]